MTKIFVIIRKNERILIVHEGSVSGEGDVARIVSEAIEAFRRMYPTESLFDCDLQISKVRPA